MEEIRKPKWPIATAVAVCLVSATLGVGVFRFFVEVRPLDPNLPPWFAAVVGASTLLVLAALTLFIAQGRNWARILYLLMFVAGVPTMLAVASEIQVQLAANPGSVIWLTLQWLAQLVAIVLLFTSTSNSWFRAMKAHRRAA